MTEASMHVKLFNTSGRFETTWIRRYLVWMPWILGLGGIFCIGVLGNGILSLAFCADIESEATNSPSTNIHQIIDRIMIIWPAAILWQILSSVPRFFCHMTFTTWYEGIARIKATFTQACDISCNTNIMVKGIPSTGRHHNKAGLWLWPWVFQTCLSFGWLAPFSQQCQYDRGAKNTKIMAAFWCHNRDSILWIRISSKDSMNRWAKKIPAG